jgi:Sec-independent protein translocase protein TatA
MLGVGSTELLILVVIALMLFGPTLFAFWLGYTVGKKRTSNAQPSASAPSGAVQPSVELPVSSAATHGGSTDDGDTPTDLNSEESAQ